MTDPLLLALTQRRTDLGWAQVKLARELGWNAGHIVRLETGGNPKLSTLRALADALGCDLVLVAKPDVRVSKPGGIWPTQGDDRQ